MNTLEAEVLEPGTVTLDALKLRLASQFAPRRWRSALRKMAQQLDDGEPLEAAVKIPRLPNELSSLVTESMSLRDPTSFLLEALKAREEIRGSWRAFIAVIGYPLALLVFTTFIGVTFSFFVRGLVDFSELEYLELPGFAEVQARIDDQHSAMLGAALVIGWTALVIVTIAIAGPPWALPAVLGGLFIIGRPLRWISLQEILHRFYLFADQGIVNSNLGHAVARSFSSSSQAIVAESIARRIEAGTPLGSSFAMSMHSDGLCRPAVLLLDQKGENISQSILQTARLLGRLAEQRCRVMSMIMPIFLLAVVGTMLWATISCYVMIFMPLVMIISSLA